MRNDSRSWIAPFSDQTIRMLRRCVRTLENIQGILKDDMFIWSIARIKRHSWVKGFIIQKIQGEVQF
jgi:hypothetical protein